MSDHSVRIVPVVLESHGNADSLSIVKVGGFTCVVRTADWLGVDRAAYVIPDSLVDVSRPEFAFLQPKAFVVPNHPYFGYARIRAAKLRGVWSEGVLVPVKGEIGDDVTEQLGVRWYEPIESVSTDSDSEGSEGYTGHLRVYDIENMKKSGNRYFFTDGEPVIALEKLHGSNGRWRWDGERFYAGKRSSWCREGDNVWWKALNATPSLQQFLKTNPHIVVFGEVLGTQGASFNYGGGMAAFDMFDTAKNLWIDKPDFVKIAKENGIPHAPVIYDGPFDFDKLVAFADGPSVYSPKLARCREGIVVSPHKERTTGDRDNSRVIMKIIGREYSTKD